MKLAVPVFLYAVLSGSVAWASPHVVGYERFYSEKPSAKGGAILYSELGCANCHGDSPVVVPRKGPKLTDLNRRVDRDWLKGFLSDPESGRKGTTMPNMFHGLGEADIDAVLDYLGTFTTKAKISPPRHANAERGSALFHEVGCVACHAPTGDYQGPHGNGTSLVSDLAVAHPDFKKKTNIDALTTFLSNPSAYRPDGRMPHIKFDGQEAGDIAAHLLDEQGSDPREMPRLKAWPKADNESVEKGKQLVEAMKCTACHDLPKGKAPELVALSGTGKESSGSCISPEPAKGLPHYDLTEQQRESLAIFIAKRDGTFDVNGTVTLAAMNCYACHDRDGVGGPTPETDPFFIGDEALGDSGRLPPPLTGIGHKLQRKWLESVFADTKDSRVRTYVRTQMPIYPGHAVAMADWLEKLDAKRDAKPMTLQPSDIEAGRKMLGVVGGANCITCHDWGEYPSLGIHALDISSLDKRLRPEWFRSYLLDPPSYRPGTLMPPLWPGGQSTVKDVLGGDSERQIAAIWEFIKDGEGVPEGFPDHASGAFELVPTDRAIIQRTFFERAGTKAILVGFPGGISLAYDGDKAELAQVWRGPFFDAYTTWYLRAAPIEKPLSDAVYDVPVSETGARFRGYKTDEKGNPTFLSTIGSQDLQESFSVADGKLIRKISWSDGPAPPIFHPEGVGHEEKKEGNTLTITYFWK